MSISKYVVGLTGGIGSGKTTVTDIFTELGVDIVDADLVAREVVQPNTPTLKAIEEHFGSHFILDDGTLNRTALRSQVFANEADKTWLNNLLHPLIRETMLKKIAACHSSYCILVAPLLIENGLQNLVNRIVVVDVSEQTQLSRVVARDPSSKEEVERIIASQITRDERLKAADDIIDNESSDRQALKNKIQKLHQKFLQATTNFNQKISNL